MGRGRTELVLVPGAGEGMEFYNEKSETCKGKQAYNNPPPPPPRVKVGDEGLGLQNLQKGRDQQGCSQGVDFGFCGLGFKVH